jgi:hypothetical protein
MAQVTYPSENLPAAQGAVWDDAPSSISWGVRIEADTAVAAALDYLSKTHEAATGRRFVTTNFDRLIEFVFRFGREPEVSQQEFWQVHKILHSDVAPNNILILSNQYSTPKRNWTVHNALAPTWRGVTIESVVSVRARSWILKSFFDAFHIALDREELDLVQLRSVFDTELLKYITFRIICTDRLYHSDAPSTHRWAHDFVLWTGISPPVAVNPAPSIRRSFTTMRQTGGQSVPNLRSNSSRDCRRFLDWRTSEVHGQGNLQRNPLVTRSSQPRRCQRIRHDQFVFEWPLHRSRRREVVNQLLHRVRRWA